MEIFEDANPAEVDPVRRERHREREFYKYYEPICSLSSKEPVHVNLFDKAAARNHIACSSPDKALTAFCQLGALRLQARRCLLFFFDCDYAYVLAESTRTLSLLDDQIHEDDDALWLGNVVIPRGISICEHTVNIPEANHGSNKHAKNAGAVHIINNLQEDTRFCDRPFVTEGPLARFYAGVPITTPSGFRIGAFCILDDKPRDGLADKDVSFLCQMGETVMSHIETVRSRAEFSRGSRMLTSMEAFFSSTSVARNASIVPDTAEKADIKADIDAEITRSYFAEGQQSGSIAGSEVSPTGSRRSSVAPITNDDSPTKHGAKISPAADELDIGLERSVKSTFETAATLARSSSDIDGIVFLELTNQSSNNIRTTRGTASDIESGQDTVEGNSTEDADTDVDPDTPAPCAVLGSSLHPRCPAKPHINMIPAKLIKTLLRRNPCGKVFYFDSDGDVSAGESSSEQRTSINGHSPPSSGQDEDDLAPVSRPRRASRAQASADLQALFPGVRALGIIGMYDQTKKRTYAGAIIWTYSPVRILTAEGELGYLRAFGDVIMSNVARLQARMEDQAKSDFISSISHELRSPLHGILGSIDFLQEQDAIDKSVVAQIERCGVTLMDVIEHLLDFAKINNLSQTHMPNNRRESRVHAWLDNPTNQDGGRLQSIAKLTEEVADATFYSHCCSLDIKDQGNVSFVLDVASDSLEAYKVPVGAWKRLCINIINNALKYTSRGHVSVSLRASFRSRKRPAAVLTVTDTGCGMSRAFLEHRLFKAFSQEDGLATGTGLGMSLVAKLVRSVGGKIEVQSTKHVGTTVRISIPLEAKELLGTTQPQHPAAAAGLRVRLPRARNESDEIKRNDRTLQHTALDRICKAIGAEIVDDNADITLVLESDLPQLLADVDLQGSVLPKAVIVLCTSFASATTLRHSALSKALSCQIEYIPQPYGPERILDAIKKCQTPTVSNDEPAIVSVINKLQSTTLVATSSSMADDELKEEVVLPRAASEEDVSQLATVTLDGESGISDNSTAVCAGSTVFGDSQPSRPVTAIGAQETPTAAAPEVTGNQPLSLLIVDDNPINVRILMTYADRNKHPRITASNGEEAVMAYKAAALPVEAGIDEFQVTIRKPEVVFMDLTMPVMDGFEASRRIRAFEKSNGIPPAIIIALTGLGSAEAHRQALSVGIDIFLTKPLRPKDLTPLLTSIAEGLRETQTT